MSKNSQPLASYQEPGTITYKRAGGKYTVLLDNRGNPDYRQDPDRRLPGTPCIEAHTDTLVEARELCLRYIAICDLGGGNWTGGQVTRITDNVVIGRFSYNGRLWNIDDEVPGMREIALKRGAHPIGLQSTRQELFPEQIDKQTTNESNKRTNQATR